MRPPSSVTAAFRMEAAVFIPTEMGSLQSVRGIFVAGNAGDHAMINLFFTRGCRMRFRDFIAFAGLFSLFLFPPTLLAAPQFVDKWGSSGPANGQFSGASGIAVDGLGQVYVADTNNHRIQKFRGDGTFLLAWGS